MIVNDNDTEIKINLGTIGSSKENEKCSLNLSNDKHLISIYDAKRAEKEHMDSNLKYHIEFFRNGLNAIIKLWLADGCQESPEEMAEVLKSEYRGR